MWRRVGWAFPALVLALAVAGCSLFGGADRDDLRGAATTPRTTGVTAPQETKLDLVYATASAAEKLDLYLPARTGAAVPLVIAIHGGGWQEGDKRDDDGMVGPLRKQGYAVASINYRLSGEAPFPAALLDTKAAIRWLRAHAAEYGLDPDHFAAWGFSAGGNLAAMVAVTPSRTGAAHPAFNDPRLGNAGVSSAVQAVVDLYGPSDLSDMDRQLAHDRHCPTKQESHTVPWSSESKYLGAKLRTVLPLARQASPLYYVKSAAKIPPFYLAHGRADCTVPDRQSSTLAQALRARKVRTKLTIVPGFGHADPAFDEQQGAPALAFVDDVFGRG